MTIRRSLLIALALPSLASAQYVCKPSPSSNEAKLLAWFAGPLAFAAYPEVSTLGAGEAAIFGELTVVPKPPSSISRSTGQCGFSKSENSGLAPAFPRPRFAIGVGGGVVLEAAWIPPVTVADATAHMGALAVSWTSSTGMLPGDGRLLLRAHGTLGGVNGPVTCPKDGLQQTNPSQPCYGTNPSDDTYNPNVYGVEGIGEWDAGPVRLYGGLGGNQLMTHFKVNFTDSRGFTDRNEVEITIFRPVVLVGAAWRARPWLALSGQVYSVPQDATTLRVGLDWLLK